jgi:hypothetical protein
MTFPRRRLPALFVLLKVASLCVRQSLDQVVDLREPAGEGISCLFHLSWL